MESSIKKVKVIIMFNEWSKNPFFRFKPYHEYLKLTVDKIFDYYNFWYSCLDMSGSMKFNDFIRKQIVSSFAALSDASKENTKRAINKTEKKTD
jgi:hypothetical protein